MRGLQEENGTTQDYFSAGIILGNFGGKFNIIFLKTTTIEFIINFLKQTSGNVNHDQDLFWAARGKKASLDGNWQDSVLVEPYNIVDKRDGSAVPFWAARGKKYAAESGDGLPFWAARGKKGKIQIGIYNANHMI